MVVLRTDNPSPVVIWPDNQDENSNSPVMMESDFQQPNPVLPKAFQNDKTEVDYVYASAETLEGVAEAGKDFEMTLEALDKEIARYDHTLTTCTEPLSPMGPIISGPTNPSLHSNPTSPLANITNLSPSQTKTKPNTPPKWTRIKRQGSSNKDSVDLNAALGETMILERLDCAFATPTWLELFPATRVQHIHSNASDHNPIIIKPEGIVQCKNKPFCFESMWMKDVRCKKTIIDAWGLPSFECNMLLAPSKIKSCSEKLVEWSRSSFGSIKRQLAEASKMLVSTKEAAARGGSIDQEINELIDKESLMWFQRARAMYLQLGDSNTRFFHSRASQRFKRNRILGLKNNQNIWCTSEHQLHEIATSFYRDLFTSCSP
ncbi:hypothetical protein CFP56_013490, partial [Quercus suber]